MQKVFWKILEESLLFSNLNDFVSQYECVEAWGDDWERKTYTVVLLLLQYIIPLCVMALSYLLAWRKLYAHNESMIRMQEEYEQSMEWNVPQRKKSQVEGEGLDWDHSKEFSGNLYKQSEISYAFDSNSLWKMKNIVR